MYTSRSSFSPSFSSSSMICFFTVFPPFLFFVYYIFQHPQYADEKREEKRKTASGWDPEAVDIN